MATVRSTNQTSRIGEIRKQRARIVRFKVLFVLVGLLVLLTGVVLLMRLQSLRINTITVSGTNVIDPKDVQKIVEDELKQNYVYVFPKQNGLLFPRHTIRQKLFDAFPRFEQVAIGHPSLREITITVMERESVYLWCGMRVPGVDSPDTSCYYVDENGFIFSKAPYFSGTVYFRFFGSNKPILESDPIGESVLPQTLWNQIVLLKENLESLGFAPHSLAIYNGGEYAFLLSGVPVDTKLRIVFGDKYDFKKIFSNLSSALEVEPLKTDITKKFTLLEYIDLRYDNKVYYKFGQPAE